MPISKKYDLLFIKDAKSDFDSNSQMFAKLFNNVDKVLDNAEGLKLLEKNQYDIIIKDISMDFLEGSAFVKQLKEMKPKQEVIALTALDDEGKLSEMIDLGIHFFLLTPVDFDQALEAITQMELTV